MKTKIVTLLCSGVALGVYVPALLLDNQLKKNNVLTDVVVLENLMPKDKKEKILENKKAFHNSFRLALTGQKMAKDLWPSLDLDLIEQMFTLWRRENRKDFIVFSGFWMSILWEYAKRSNFSDLNIDIVHMDADISASWKNVDAKTHEYNHIWLFRWKEKRLLYEIPITDRPPVPYLQRSERYVIHGGGWGMGTYQSKIGELESAGLSLDIVAYDRSEIVNPNHRYFMMDPSWSPWLKNQCGFHEFPPFGEVRMDQTECFINNSEYHGLYDVIRVSLGIISKPGGATLLDSLASATPIIILDPFGDYEQKNADLWEYLGFGVSYNQWKESGYSTELLEKLHSNLLNVRGTLKNYALEYGHRYNNVG